MTDDEANRYERARKRVREIRGFYSHLAIYLIVNAGLLAINLLTSPFSLWFYWPMLGWGLGVAADIGWEKRCLYVRQQAGRTSAGLQNSEPKTSKGRRMITLPSIAMDALKEHRAEQLELRLSVGPKCVDNDLVFANLVGNPRERQNIQRRSFKPLLRKAGLPDIRFHDLRYSMATLLLSLGEHPKVVQERLGHASISVTMDTYSHVMPELQRETARKLDSVYGVA